jgi:hypothetical protein
MRTLNKNTSKLTVRFDKELLNLLKNDLKSIRAKKA